MRREDHLLGDINERLPIIPHENLGANCCGCLYVRVEGKRADIVCNECAAVIRTVSVGDVERVVKELAQTDTICRARCTHCGTLNSFPGFAVVDVFVCPECGEGNAVANRVQ
jgi:hypothetical protein